LCTLSLLSGLWSASDTLSPQAYGAGQKPIVGYIAMRGLIGSVLVLLPTMTVLNLFLERLLVDDFGQDATAAQQAFGWYRVYSLSLPFHAVFGIVWKFLAAQDVMYPIVVCSIVSIGLVLPAALRYSTTYTGTAAAVVFYEMIQAIGLLAWLGLRRPHDPLTWPGLVQVWKHALQWRPFATFMVRTRVIVVLSCFSYHSPLFICCLRSFMYFYYLSLGTTFLPPPPFRCWASAACSRARNGSTGKPCA
jgi:Na+-driven multidrug efflux pump